MINKKALCFSLVAAFALSGCGGDSGNNAGNDHDKNDGVKKYTSGYVHDARSCREFFLEEVVAKGRKADAEDFYILNKTRDNEKVAEVCHYREDPENGSVLYREIDLRYGSIEEGTTESKYPYTAIMQSGMTEERTQELERARKAFAPK